MEKILSKIRKLLALANGKGATEAEAMLAMEKAHELLAQHGLSMSVVEAGQGEAGEIRVNNRIRDLKMPWESTVFDALGKLNFCLVYTMTRNGRKGIYFVGRESSVETSKLMAEYVIETIVRLSNAAVAETGLKEGDRHHWRRSFRFAAARRVQERCIELRQQREAAPTTTSSGTNLPALAPLYNQERRENEVALRSHGITLNKARKSRINLRSGEGYAAGRAAGDTISLNRQVR